MTRAACQPQRGATREIVTEASMPSAGAFVIVGKDVLELLSSAMYVEPLSIYREYVQNAADAIDEARSSGVLPVDELGRVRITLDSQTRTVRIRDNGAGISTDEAAQRLLSVGASAKRGTSARGFRGVGRLAGLAYCRQLTFRTRGNGDGDILELRWDCLRLKAALREVGEAEDLPAVIDKIVSLRRYVPSPETPAHFFEVELAEIVRNPRRDVLLNEEMIADYLAEVAPVPFDETFSFGDILAAHITPHVQMGNLQLTIGDRAPLRRPHRDMFPISDIAADRFSGYELLSFGGRDGGLSAVGWLLHHNYLGALPLRARLKGLRLRCGNVQIGDSNVLEEIYPEPRFNSWTVGEIHVLDRRIVPNARRDHFEQNVHYDGLTAQIEPLARQIAKRCRTASVERNRVKALRSTASLLLEELDANASFVLVYAQILERMGSCLRRPTTDSTW
jgi:Histidine kinase-, DNA gyrase B-, and HSP90-like ATPase